MENPSPAIPKPGFKELALAIPPEKPSLWFSWDFQLVLGAEELPGLKGHRTIDFCTHSADLETFLRQCDQWFNADVPNYIITTIRCRLLDKLGKPNDSGPIPEAEIVLKLTYNIKVWGLEREPYETKGIEETTVNLDPGQIRGHIMALERSYQRNIFNQVRSHFRYLAYDWIEGFPPGPSSQKALDVIEQEINEIFRPEIVPQDARPPTIGDIEVAVRRMVAKPNPSNRR
jgi:hypothetical protein